MTNRRRFTAEFKARVAHGRRLHLGRFPRRSSRSRPSTRVRSDTEVSAWKRQSGGRYWAKMFDRTAPTALSQGDHESEVRDLHAKIGELDGGTEIF